MEIKEQWNKQERDSWLKILNVIQQENIFFKHNLANLLKNDIKPDTLEKGEQFQNQFLNMDTVIAILRHDVAVLNNLLGDEGTPDDTQEKLRTSIKKMETEFAQLQSKFNGYLCAAR